MDYKQILGLNADNGPHPGPTPQYPHFAHPAEYYSAPFIQRTETKIKRASFPVFHFTYLCIVAEFITTVHKLLCLHIEILLFCQPVFLAEAFAFLIHIAYHLANQHSLLRMIIPMNGPPHHFLFRNTGKGNQFSANRTTRGCKSSFLPPPLSID